MESSTGNFFLKDKNKCVVSQKHILIITYDYHYTYYDVIYSDGVRFGAYKNNVP